jgi:hypothetical protein
VNLRALGFQTVVFFTRVFIVSIFVLSLLLAYFTFFPKKDKVYVALTNKTGSVISQRSLHVLNSPGINTQFVGKWVTDVVNRIFNFNMNSKGENLEAVKSKFLNYNQFFEEVYQPFVKNSGANLVVESIINGAFVSSYDNLVFVKPNVWNITVPVLMNISGIGSLATFKKRLVTVTVKKIPTRDAPLSGLGIVSVADQDMKI